MNKGRPTLGVAFGQPGHLTYFPAGSELGGEHGLLRTSRVTSNPSHFRIAGQAAELYPPSITLLPKADLEPARERRVQERWLYNHHSTALAGIGPLDEYLAEDLTNTAKSKSSGPNRQRLAIGQISNVTNPSYPQSLPAIATAAGEAGETLRIARIEQSRWAWQKSHDDPTYQVGSSLSFFKDATLELAVIDPNDKEDECFWTDDSLPISRIKFATHVVPSDPIRWLLVQKATSTTLLCPEFHNVPVEDVNAWESHPPSRIKANPVVTIAMAQTGGRAHSDVSFNPSADGNRAQLAVIDECGYWTIWEVQGQGEDTRGTRRAVLRYQGHVQEGFMPEFPVMSTYPEGLHGALFIGTNSIDSFRGDSQKLEGSTLQGRAPYLLVWDEQRLEIIDLRTQSHLQNLKEPELGPARRNAILDVQMSPVTQDHVFVLTTQALLWIDVPHEGLSSKPKLIMECPHLPPIRDGMRMSVSQASGDNQETVLVFTYFPGSTFLTINWFSLSEETSLPQWQRSVVSMRESLPTSPENAKIGNPNLETVLFSPAGIKLSDHAVESSPGRLYAKEGVLFYQGLLLDEELSLRYCVGIGSQVPELDVSLPTSRLDRDELARKKRWRKKRKHFLRLISEAFVLPDGIAETDHVAEHEERAALRHKASRRVKEPLMGSKVIKVDRLLDELRRRVPVIETEEPPCLPAMTADVLSQILENGSAQGNLPLFTIQDVVDQYCMPGVWEPAEKTERELAELRDRWDGEVTMPLLGSRPQEEELPDYRPTVDEMRERIDQTSAAEMLNMWPRISTRELASRMALKQRGFLVQDVPLFGAGPGDVGAQESYSQRSIHTQPTRSSQSPARIKSSSPPPMILPESLSRPFQRLNLLAGLDLDSPATEKKKNSLEDRWPTERGSNPYDYVSTVAEAQDTQFDDARKRRERIEAKLGRTRANKEKLERRRSQLSAVPESSAAESAPRDVMRSSPPPVALMSSQPQSQSQGGGLGGMIMSQPVGGTFGDRKKAKKGKKKKLRSGFR